MVSFMNDNFLLSTTTAASRAASDPTMAVTCGARAPVLSVPVMVCTTALWVSCICWAFGTCWTSWLTSKQLI